MLNFKKILMILFFLVYLFLVLNSVSSADYYVNEDTSHENITNWMKNRAKTGDSLIFNTSKYNLTNRLDISKSITIKSYKNTHIDFIQEDEVYRMFKITGKNVLISGLTLNHYGNGNMLYPEDGEFGTTISGSRVDLKNTVINTNLIYGVSVSILKGNIVNCTINSKFQGIVVFKWKGNIINSRINAKQGITNRVVGSNNVVDYWYGDMVNSGIVSGKNGMEVTLWRGNIINSTIRTNDSKSSGIIIKYGEGRIHGSKIISKNGHAIKISDSVRITNSSLSSRKGFSKTIRYLPDLKIHEAFMSRRTCHITVSNIGSSTSKPVKLGLRVGKILKIVPIKSIRPFIPQEHSPNSLMKNTAKVKITLPKKYASEKYFKTVKVDYYNKIKETNKKNNVFRFKL